jgi:hypothetical protein
MCYFETELWALSWLLLTRYIPTIFLIVAFFSKLFTQDVIFVAFSNTLQTAWLITYILQHYFKEQMIRQECGYLYFTTSSSSSSPVNNTVSTDKQSPSYYYYGYPAEECVQVAAIHLFLFLLFLRMRNDIKLKDKVIPKWLWFVTIFGILSTFAPISLYLAKIYTFVQISVGLLVGLYCTALIALLNLYLEHVNDDLYLLHFEVMKENKKKKKKKNKNIHEKDKRKTKNKCGRCFTQFILKSFCGKNQHYYS